MNCEFCEGYILGPEALRIREGGVEYEDWEDFHGAAELVVRFISTGFQDGVQFKWVCPACAAMHNILVNVLKESYCTMCNSEGFSPMSEIAFSEVIHIERGVFNENAKSGAIQFSPLHRGNVCLSCAHDQMDLTVGDLLSPDDMPEEQPWVSRTR